MLSYSVQEKHIEFYIMSFLLLIPTFCSHVMCSDDDDDDDASALVLEYYHLLTACDRCCQHE